MGDAPSRYSSVVGCGTYLALIALAQISTRAEAQELLERCLDEHPGFLGAVHPLADAMLANQVAPEEVVERIESRVTKLTPSVRFMLGMALYESGAAEAAEPQFRAVLEQQPSSMPARVALGEAVLSQGRYLEAAEVAAEVGEGEPGADAARRTEMFSLLVSGEIDRAAQTLERGRADMHRGDADLFAAWQSAASGGELPPALPRDAAPLLTLALEALLRVQEVDAFGMLVPLIDRVGLPARERREMLASMYMRRGYLQSAADEWIGSIQELGPDAPALTGLALVAAAREMPEDALVFAREARQLDPGYAQAARLVQNLEAAAA
jgi:tetratricopeptide (TPR) repeat protein